MAKDKKYSPQIILMSTTGLYPYQKDAPARLLKTIGEELALRNISVSLICLSQYQQNALRSPVNWNKVFSDIPVTVWHKVKGKNFLHRRFQEILACVCAVKQMSQGSLLMFNSPPFGFFSLLILISKISGMKVAYIAHGGIFTENPHTFFNRIMRLNIHIFSLFIDSIIAVSHAFANDLRKVITTVPIKVIHNSYECLPRQYISKKTETHSKKFFNIFYMGRLEKVKRIDILLTAFQQLNQKYNNCHLIIAGKGHYEQELKILAKKMNIESAISFVGFINQKKKEIYFCKSNIFVLPSSYETFGMVLLESMCFKVPIVASRVGGIPEIIEDKKTGLLFEAGNSKSLFKKIEILYSDEQKRNLLAKNAYNKLLKDFCLNRMGNDYHNFVQELTNNSSGKPLQQ